MFFRESLSEKVEPLEPVFVCPRQVRTGVNTPLNAMFEHTKRIDWERRGERLPCKIRGVIESTFPSRGRTRDLIGGGGLPADSVETNGCAGYSWSRAADAVNVDYAADLHASGDRMRSSPSTLWVPIYMFVSAPGIFSEGFLR